MIAIDFQRYLKENKVKEVVVTAQDIRGEFTEPVEGKSRFVTTRVEGELALSEGRESAESKPAGRTVRPIHE